MVADVHGRVHVHLPPGLTRPQAEGHVLAQLPLAGVGRELVVAEPRVDRPGRLHAHVLEHVPVHQQTAGAGRRKLDDLVVLVVEHHVGDRIIVRDEQGRHCALGGDDHAQRAEDLHVTLVRPSDHAVQRVRREHHVGVAEPQPVALGMVVEELDDQPVARLGEVAGRFDRHVVVEQTQIDRRRRLRCAERLPHLNRTLPVEHVELDVGPQEPGGDVVAGTRECEQRPAWMVVHVPSCDAAQVSSTTTKAGSPEGNPA